MCPFDSYNASQKLISPADEQCGPAYASTSTSPQHRLSNAASLVHSWCTGRSCNTYPNRVGRAGSLKCTTAFAETHRYLCRDIPTSGSSLASQPWEATSGFWIVVLDKFVAIKQCPLIPAFLTTASSEGGPATADCSA